MFLASLKIERFALPMVVIKLVHVGPLNNLSHDGTIPKKTSYYKLFERLVQAIFQIVYG